MSAAEHLKGRIEETGPVTVADYMTIALTHPDGGYYMSGDPFGRGGDFITAPEISQMFGELLGLWTAVVWQAMGAPSSVHLVELGPGRGTLMSDMLRAALQLPPFLDALDVHLVEISPALGAAQEKTLADARARGMSVSWAPSFDRVPDGPVIVIANEFFDALPVRQFHKTPDGWRERLVGVKDDGGFRFLLADDEADHTLLPEGADELDAGALVEVSPIAMQAMGAVARRMVDYGGAGLVIDYGYGAGGFGETLQAVKAHAYADVLKNVGEADLTAHVNFTALADAARAAGAAVHGPVPQGAFLERLGLSERLGALMAGATAEQAAELEAAYRRLTDADEMGVLFKVLAVTQPGLSVPPWA